MGNLSWNLEDLGITGTLAVGRWHQGLVKAAPRLRILLSAFAKVAQFRPPAAAKTRPEGSTIQISLQSCFHVASSLPFCPGP